MWLWLIWSPEAGLCRSMAVCQPLPKIGRKHWRLCTFLHLSKILFSILQWSPKIISTWIELKHTLWIVVRKHSLQYLQFLGCYAVVNGISPNVSVLLAGTIISGQVSHGRLTIIIDEICKYFKYVNILNIDNGRVSLRKHSLKIFSSLALDFSTGMING